MLLIRGFEERVAALYRDGEVPGFVHLSIGQEATAVGACWPLRRPTSSPRPTAATATVWPRAWTRSGMFAELMGKDQGTNRGRGGSMHIADPKLGIFGANGIVAAGLPIAAGAATAAQLRADGSVAVAFFGDGAVAQGAFHEALNLAAVWELPVVFFCENNGYAEFSPASTQHAASLEQRAAGYGIPFAAVDGNDVVATASLMEHVVAARARWRARSSLRPPPTVGTATTRGIPERYRSADEVQAWEARDPLLVHEAGCAGRRGRRRAQVPGVVGGRRPRRARSRPPAGWPARRRHLGGLRRAGEAGAGRAGPSGRDAPVFRTMDAVRSALEAELSRRRPGLRRRHRRRRRRQCVRADPGPGRQFGAGCGTPRSPRRPSSASASGRPWPGCTPWSR